MTRPAILPTPPPKSEKDPAVYDLLLGGTAYLDVSPKSGSGWSGTGWILDAQRRLIITNVHVADPEELKGPKSIAAWFPVIKDGDAIHDLDYYSQNVKRIPATVIYTDATRDLALLQLDSLPTGAREFNLAERSARVAELLHSLAAFPRGSEGLFIYTQGTSRTVYKRSIATGGTVMVLETQMPLNNGNSGGPIVNDKGEVVGVHEGSMIGPSVQLVCMSIDLSELKGFLEEGLPLVEPKSVEEWNKRGDHHYDASRYDLALADYTQALRLDPKNVEAISNRGWVHFQNGDLDTALAEFNDALKLDEKFANALSGRGAVYRGQKEFDKATKEFTEAIRHVTDAKELANLYNERGNTHSRKEDYAAAVADFDRGIEKNPQAAWFHGNRGEALGELGRYDEAFKSVDRAIELDRRAGDFWNIAGNIWFKRERYDFAANMYSSAIQTKGDVAVYYRNRGAAYREAGNFQNGVNDLVKAIELSPQDDDYWNELGTTWYRAGRYIEAVAAFDKAIELNADNAVYFHNRGDAFQKLGQHEKAVADLTKAIASDDSAELHAMRGNSYQALGNLAAAKADFDEAGDESGYELFDRKFIRVVNDTNQKLKVHLRYHTLMDDDTWKWFPETDDSVTYTFEPGESAVLFHDDWKVNTDRVRIWAYGEETNWLEWRDRDVPTVPEGGYLSKSGRETWTVPFRVAP